MLLSRGSANGPPRVRMVVGGRFGGLTHTSPRLSIGRTLFLAACLLSLVFIRSLYPHTLSNLYFSRICFQ